MGAGIERRAKRDLSSYCIVDPNIYEDIGRYVSQASKFKDSLQELVPLDWSITRAGIWHHVTPPLHAVQKQGFKIHVSASCRTAIEVLRRAVPILVARGTAFKIVVDEFLLNFVNSKNYSRSGSGKFITAYPQAADFQCLLDELAAATSGLEGPFILSDKPYKNSKTVFYRYGSFVPEFRLNLFGEKEALIRLENGTAVPDVRAPYFRLPEGIKDPFESVDLHHEGPVVLRERYKIESTIVISNCGGVYRARDLLTDATVIVKEARPHINLNGAAGLDAVATLKKEHLSLQILKGEPFVPQVIDFFQEWEHFFLVEEFVSGTVLSSYRALSDLALILQRTVRPEGVVAFCERVRTIARNLIAAVLACHEKGIIVGDLTPANIIVNLETLGVTLIDFEGAHIVEDKTEARKETGTVDTAVTLGYIAPWRLAGANPAFKDDYYAIGAVIYSLILPVQVFFPLNPEAAPRFIGELAKDYQLPAEILRTIRSLLKGDVKEAARHLESPLTTHFSSSIVWPALQLVPEEALESTLAGIARYLLASADVSRKDRLWPSDYRVFSTNALSLAYGALGPALHLKQTKVDLPSEIVQWMLNTKLSTQEYAPGFFIGLAGIAWGFAELGFEDRAVEAMKLVYESPLLQEGADLFYGLAGAGLASIYFWRRTGEQEYLRRACEIGDRILGEAVWEGEFCIWKNADGLIYSGYAHGASGIALFLLALYLDSKEEKYLQMALKSFETEISRGIERDGCLVWERIRGDGVLAPYWRYGTAGVGSVAIRFYATLGQERYKQVAEKAAKYVLSKYAVFPGQMTGLSGIGEFLLDMYHFTGEAHYLHQAHTVASGVMLYAVPQEHGIAFPGEELIRLSADFATGAAGIGAFLHRLLNQARTPRLVYDCNSLQQPAAVEMAAMALPN